MSDKPEIVSIDLPLIECGIEHDETFDDLIADFERLTSEGWRVTFTELLSFGPNNEHPTYKIVERSTGGAGVTKFYEIAVYCPMFHSQLNAYLDGKAQPSLHSIIVPNDYFGLRGCLNYCAWQLVERGYDPTPKAVGFWRTGGPFEFVGDQVPNPFDVWGAVAYALEHKDEAPFNQGKNLGSFAGYLCKNFDEDSLENIVGRIFSKTLELFDKRDGKKSVAENPRNKERVANGLFEIGQLYERLLWKVRYEPSAARGKKEEKAQKKRDKGSGDSSASNRISRIEELLDEIEDLLGNNPDIGSLGLKQLAQVAVKRAKSKNPKLWSQGMGRVQSYLEDVEFDPRFSKRVQRIKAQTA